MQLKETAFGYNLTTESHSNSDWGAEIGQGKKKLMDVAGISEILNGMLYYKIEDINRITAVLGKGNRTLKPLGDYAPDTSIVVASLFERVMLNGDILVGEKFIMFVTRDERVLNNKSEPNDHYLRRYLKFSDKAKCDGIPYNKQCIDAITRKLGCKPDGSWIVTDMDFIDDTLSLTAMVIDREKPYDFKDKKDRSKILKRLKYLELKDKFKSSSYDGDLSSVILYGPPGTGKTYKMQTEYVSKFDKDNIFITTFHQSFAYEEFIEGLKPFLDEADDNEGNIKYKVINGIFREACERAVQLAGYASLADCISDSFENRSAKFNQAKDDKKFVLLCIDEINRGNVAAIFGDLISLIEDNKRLGVDKKTEIIVSLPYSQDKFGVPANLLIVGTMNTADRSIQLLDSALRRRFKFEELLPNYDVIENDDAKNVLKNINARVRCLLNKDNQIGHSYLMHAKNSCDILSALYNKIIPLLEEYFYNDITKVRFVLNDLKNGQFYVEDTETNKAYQSYLNDGDVDGEEREFFKLNPSIADAIKSKDETECNKFLVNLLSKGV